MVGPAEFLRSLKRSFRLCSLGSNSQGKLFIGLILNVMLFGINITQTYIYYIHSKKCVSSLSHIINCSMSFFCMFISEIHRVSKYRWANDIWTPGCLLLTTLNQQVIVVFVADFIQPTFLSIYLYRTLIVHFGMRWYISNKPLNL